MKVIIIGAGLSGITAARDLIQLGFEVQVLEARSRVGGRICSGSHHFNGTPVDLGASWIHGVDGNPLGDVARTLKLKVDVTNNPNLTTGENYEIYDNDGNRIDNTLQEKLRAKFDSFISAGRKTLERFEHDLSMEEMLHHSSKSAPEQFTKEEQHFLDWLKAGVEGWDNTDLSDLSARNHFWEHDAPLFSGGDGFVADGFYKIVQHLASDIAAHVYLSHVVERVEYTNQNVRVTTNKGVFTADYLLITVPLGVLKARSIGFHPPLPSWKEEAIEKIGFGLMNKIYLEFPEIFWDPKIEGIGYVSKAHRGEFGFFVTLNQLLQKPMMVCFVAAEFAKKVEKWTDEEIIDRVVEILTSIYGKHRQVPRPTAYAVTRWGNDPFARGSYSYMRVHSTPAHLENLAKPVGRIHFAGEATAKYPGYTHGAFLSAKREVDRIRKRTFPKPLETPQHPVYSGSVLTPAYVSEIKAKL
jgi:monoamine oxidase